MVDPSFDAFTEKILKQVTELGFTRDDIRWILLTHCHIDHAQSALYWQNLGKEIYIHSNDLNPIRNGNELTAWWLVDDERGFPKLARLSGLCWVSISISLCANIIGGLR